MSIVQLSDLVRIFFKHPLSYIPIVDENLGGDIYLIGFLSREKVFHYSSDKDRLQMQFERIPDFFISKEISPEVIWEFFEKSPIPIYTIFAKFVDNWTKNDINYHLKNFLYSVKMPYQIEQNSNNDVIERDREKYYFLEIILSAFPYPIFAIDVHGNSLFYNEFFLKEIIDQGPFKKTLALAESYFKELVKDVIAESILKNIQSDTLYRNWKELKRKIVITNLLQEKEVIGYLLLFIPEEIFSPKKEIVLDQDSISFLFNEFIENELKTGKNYDQIIEEIESKIIRNFLNKNKKNITHTAETLKIKRTTLQNKIKRLNLNTEFNTDELKEESLKENKQNIKKQIKLKKDEDKLQVINQKKIKKSLKSKKT